MKLLKPAKKSLGQNFLIDKNIINKIINISKVEEKSTILEIGSGYGNLTEEIIKAGPKKIYAIEKDKEIFGKGPVGKFFSRESLEEIMKKTQAKVGDSIFLACGKQCNIISN